MPNLAPDRPYAVVIGDVAGSRSHPQRAVLQLILKEALDSVNRSLPVLQPYQITIGDEFQGVFEDLGAALTSVLQIPLELATRRFGDDRKSAASNPNHIEPPNLRFGVGWGNIPVHDQARAPFAQDGPGWWAARDALDRVKQHEGKSLWPNTWRVAFGSTDTSFDGMVNAYLLCRDEVLSQLDPTDDRILLGLLRGETQAQIAKALGISQSAVAQRAKGKGAYAVLRADQFCRGEVE